MSEYRVMWSVDVQAESPVEAAQEARRMQLDPKSLATVFDVGMRCECGSYHIEDADEIDLDQHRTSRVS